MHRMSVHQFQFPEPFFTIKAIKEEKQYAIDEKSIVVNLGGKSLWIKNRPLDFCKSTIVRKVEIRDVRRAVVVEHYEKNGEGERFCDAIRSQWRLIYDISGQERHKGIGLWRSPKERFDYIDLNLCFINAGVDTGLHKGHSPNFREVHTQLMGYGKMQKFEKNDLTTLYQEVILAPGNTHEPFFDRENVYPWHQYHSISDAVYMPIEVLPA
jgi:hypothetical protein